MEQGQQMQLRDYVRALGKRWVFILLFTLTVTLSGGIYSLAVPPRFDASARVLLRSESPGLTVVLGQQQQGEGFGATGLSLETYARMMTSSENAKRVAQQLASRTSGQRYVASEAQIVQAITATTEPPDVIKVDAVAPTKEESIAFANQAVDSFILLVGDFQRAQETAAKEFVEGQLLSTTDEIHSISHQMQRLRAQANLNPGSMPVPAADGTGGLEYVNLLQNYSDRLTTLDGEVAAASAQLTQVQSALAARKPYKVEEQPVPNPLRQDMEKQLVSYESAYADLEGRYTASHPALIDMKGQIAQLKKQLAGVPPVVNITTSESDPGYAALSSQELTLKQKLADLEGQRKVIGSAVQQLRSEAKAGANVEQQTEELQSRLSLLRDVQKRLVQELEVHKMNEAMKSEVAAVLDRAVVATPRTPRLSRTLLFAMLLGLVASCGLAIFFEMLDDTVRDPDDLRRYTDLLYLGMVPRMEQVEDPLVVHAAPKSPYAEAYRSVRSQVNFRLWEKPGRALLVTSCLAGEGKTMTLCNLAAAYAQAGQRVLVVDTDLRRPATHKVLGLSNDRGLTNVVVGEAALDDVIQDTRVPGLQAITSGPLPPNPAELLESQSAKKVVQQLRERADVVLMDSPPCMVITDAAILASEVDHLLFVVQSGQVNARELKRAEEAMGASRASVLGVVLNRVPLTRGGYYYYYYYYYYGYGRELRQQAQRAAEDSGDQSSPSAPA